MSVPADMRRGWCPTALRPMASGDGLLLRLAMPGGILPAETARGIADCARRCGNGFIDLTQRANLQLRGVSEATLQALVARLGGLDLLPPDSEPEIARAIVASPLAGLDADAALDIRPVVAALRARLAVEPMLAALPAKFCIAVDDGGRWPLDVVAADIRFVAMHDEGGSEPRFAVALGGAAHDAPVIGACAPADLPQVAAALAYAFLALAGTGRAAPRRMGELVGREGAGAIVAALRAFPLPLRERAPLAPQEGAEWPDTPPLPSSADADDTISYEGRGRRPPPLISLHRFGSGHAALGVGAPFGRLTADQLDALAEAAESAAGELRLTPWRAVLLPCPASQAAALGARLASAGLIADPADARLAVVACPGAPACPRGTTRTRDDAGVLAPLARRIGEGIALHVSGCAKGCACGRSTRATLIGRDGRYDLVIDGMADGVPAATALTLGEAIAALQRLAGASDTPELQAPGHCHPIIETAS